MRKSFKPFIFTALACTFLLGAGMSAQAASKVAINDTNFSSAVKTYAEKADSNEDGYLSNKEASKIKKVRFAAFYNIDSFKGIEYFTNLEDFFYRANYKDEDEGIYDQCTASVVDLSGFTKLERVEIESRTSYLKTISLENCSKLKKVTIENYGKYGDITNINLKNCTNIQELECVGINATKMNLSGLKKLTETFITGSRLQTINLKNCSNLKTASVGGDNLAKLKLKGAKKLEKLDVTGGPLTTSLDLSTNTQLKDLSLGWGTGLTSLDLSHNTKLTTMSCYRTELTVLDFSHNKNLVKVDCHNNKNIASINVTGCKKLKNLRCDNTKVSRINVKTNTNLQKLRCENTPLTKLNLKKNTKLQNLRCENTDIRELDLTNTKIRKRTALKCDSDVSVTYAAK